MVCADAVTNNSEGFTVKVSTPWGSAFIQTKMIGDFNVGNILAAVSVMGCQGIDLSRISEALKEVKPLNGRMSTYGGGAHKPLVVVDYAHTPDALENALKSLRKHCSGRLICVFGCGGERDQGKDSILHRRPLSPSAPPLRPPPGRGAPPAAPAALPRTREHVPALQCPPTCRVVSGQAAPPFYH